MRFICSFLLCLLVTACASKNRADVDQFQVLQELVNVASQSSASERKQWFVPELDSTTYPFEAGGVWKNPTLVRMRTIDKRLVGDFVVTGEGQYIFIAWAEKRGQDWLIAGWEPTLRPVVGQDVDNRWTIPTRFAAPVLRDSPAENVVRIRVNRRKSNARASGRGTPKVRVLAKGYGFGPTCRKSTIEKWLRSSTIFRDCYGRIETDRAQRGRLILEVKGTQTRPRAMLVEAMFPSPSPARCIEEGLSMLPGVGKDCQFNVRVLYSHR